MAYFICKGCKRKITKFVGDTRTTYCSERCRKIGASMNHKEKREKLNSELATAKENVSELQKRIERAIESIHTQRLRSANNKDKSETIPRKKVFEYLKRLESILTGEEVADD